MFLYKYMPKRTIFGTKLYAQIESYKNFITSSSKSEYEQEIAKNDNSIEYVDNVLLKQRNNKPQSTKNKKDRQENVIGAYYIKNEYKIYNKKILLLDDIYTTGSTVNECARMLKEYGASIVDVITIAKD